MTKLPLKLGKKLQKRRDNNSFRELNEPLKGIDFFSNDYLGLAKSSEIKTRIQQLLKEYPILNGATGSRLISGNHELFKEAEENIANFHNAEKALIFNSGYDANIGFFSAVPQKGDVIFYDEYAHASIRDGLKMSLSRTYKFRHNNLEDLRQKLERLQIDFDASEVYVVTESVFSMDGDSPDLMRLNALSKELNFHLIIDEAHAVGVIGEEGRGLVKHVGIENDIFARIHTFGKALGCHGAAVLGSKDLINYLINFSRSFIYTTALPPHAIAGILAAHIELNKNSDKLKKLKKNIYFFKKSITKNKLEDLFTKSDSAIQSCIISGNTNVKEIAHILAKKGFNVKPILSPTVPQGKERLRFCIHSYNSADEISEVLAALANFVAND